LKDEHGQLKKRARKAVETRKRREKQRKNSERAYRAVRTIEESEKRFIPKLARILGVSQNSIFHHVGMPDLIVIRSDGKISFYEMKPKKGDLKKRKLNHEQRKTVYRLLKLGLEEVYIVRYEKRDKRYFYDSPIRLTTENLNEHCL